MPWLAAPARLAVFGSLLAVSSSALAYVGPGAGLGLLGIVVAVLAAVVMGFFGLVMWPIRKIAQQRKAQAPPEPAATPAGATRGKRALRTAEERPGIRRESKGS
jgi:uncharacterized iron-regulated membrane protein